MYLRSWASFLLFVNYLLVVGSGYMNVPGEPRYSIDRLAEHKGHCAHCRALDVTPFLEEVNAQLAADFTEATRKASEHQLSLIKLMDVHCLPQAVTQAFSTPDFRERIVVSAYRQRQSEGISPGIDVPPWQG